MLITVYSAKLPCRKRYTPPREKPPSNPAPAVRRQIFKSFSTKAVNVRNHDPRISIHIRQNPYTGETVLLDLDKLPGKFALPAKLTQPTPLIEWLDLLICELLRQFPGRKFSICFGGPKQNFKYAGSKLGTPGGGLESRVLLCHENSQQVHERTSALAGILSGGVRSEEVLAAHYNDLARLTNRHSLETCIVATMSSGKSTLINALLGQELLPASQEACTALILRVRDEDSYAGKGFGALAWGKDGTLKRVIGHLTSDDLRVFNKNNEISRVDIIGDIPCVPSDKVSLMLVDTPGPNNARDDNHRRIMRDQLNTASNALILYVLTAEFGSNDDYELLKHVVKVISSSDAQARDRFLFVMNKLDGRRKEDGSLERILDDLRNYLIQNGIENPRIFPIAALPALRIRRLLAMDPEMDEDEIDAAMATVRKFNRNPDFHLEKHACRLSGISPETVAALESDKIKIQKAYEESGGPQNKNLREALIHTGITVLEAAFLEYVNKYK